jgi:hypothetical protein
VGRFIFIRYDISIMGTVFCTVIISKQLFHLSPSITLGNIVLFSNSPNTLKVGIIVESRLTDLVWMNHFLGLSVYDRY